MTREQLDELERLEKEATPEWGSGRPETGRLFAALHGAPIAVFTGDRREENVTLAISLRNAAPGLIRMARENAELRDENTRLRLSATSWMRRLTAARFKLFGQFSAGKNVRGCDHSTACSVWGDDGQGGTEEGFPQPLPCNCGALENWQKRQKIEALNSMMAERDSLREQLTAAEARAEKAERELARALDNNRRRNVELDALHYVWCDGGCAGGVHRYGDHPPLTPEIVAAAVRNTRRLETWLANSQCRAIGMVAP